MSPGGTVKPPVAERKNPPAGVRKGSPASPWYVALVGRVKDAWPGSGSALNTVYKFFGHPLIVLAVISMAVGSVWYRANQMREVGDRLIAPGADRGIVSLELARS